MTDNLFKGNVHAVDPSSPVGKLLRGQPVSRPPLRPEEQRDARDLARSETCRWCGGLHARACPRVKSMTFHTDGITVLAIEYWRHDEWSDEAIIWPEDLEESGEEGGDT